MIALLHGRRSVHREGGLARHWTRLYQRVLTLWPLPPMRSTRAAMVSWSGPIVACSTTNRATYSSRLAGARCTTSWSCPWPARCVGNASRRGGTLTSHQSGFLHVGVHDVVDCWHGRNGDRARGSSSPRCG